MGTKVTIEVSKSAAAVDQARAIPGPGPAGGDNQRTPDAEVVRRVLSEHGALVRAEALAEAQVEAANPNP